MGFCPNHKFFPKCKGNYFQLEFFGNILASFKSVLFVSSKCIFCHFKEIEIITWKKSYEKSVEVKNY